MKNEDEKETEEEEIEDDEENIEKEKLKDAKLAEIKIDTSNGLNSIKFNKDKCVKNGLLEKTEKKNYIQIYIQLNSKKILKYVNILS